MTYTDALSRISQIQGQMASLGTAFNPAGAAAASPSGTSATFATALAQAQASSPSASIVHGALDTSGSLGMSGSLSGSLSPYSAGGVTAAGAQLSASAQSMLTSAQQAFASRLAADTGLDPQVVAAWLLAEESGGAATARQSANNNDWLNIGYTDSGTYGAADSVWSDPVTAADATAGWLKGQNTIPGYGTASSGIQAILSTAGQAPAAQIAALQQSGWASSGYPDLASLYQQVAA
jgi:hypothetical protein